MSKLDELRVEVAALQDEIRELSAIDEITPEQDARLDEAIAEFEAKDAERVTLEQRAAKIAKVHATQVDTTPGAGAFQYKRDTNTEVDVVRGDRAEVRDAAMKLLERSFVDADRKTAIERAFNYQSDHYDPDLVTRSLVATEAPAYKSAFAKAISGRESRWTAEERDAIMRYDEVRTVKGSVDTSGGFGVPVVIDPTIRITSGTGLLGILPYITVEPVTTDAWRGVTAAHTTWAYVAEGADGTDDAPTFAQPVIPVNTARATIPFTIEADQDYPGLSTQLGRILDSGYMDLLATKLAVGAGSTEPTGIFTSLAAITASRVTTTTIALFGAVDIDKIWAALPERFRSRAVWMMNVDVENEIRNFGSGTATSRFTVDQTAFGISLLNGRPVVTSDWAPAFTATTGAYSVLTVLDGSEYVLAQRIGMSVEYVPHLISSTNGLPNGQRGLFAYARNGGDLPVSNAGRVLRNAAS